MGAWHRHNRSPSLLLHPVVRMQSNAASPHPSAVSPCCSPIAIEMEIALMAKGTSGEQGTSMLEVLVTLVILSVGLLGLTGLITRASMMEYESYQRAQAVMLLSDMVEKINS